MYMSRPRAYNLLAAIFLLIPAISLWADETIIDMRHFREGDLAVDGFELTAKTELNIEAIGGVIKGSHDLYAYGWIIDADSREPVWQMSEEESRTIRSGDGLREFEGEITLTPGRYEAYYYAGKPFFWGEANVEVDGLGDVADILGYIFSEDEDKSHEYYSADVDEFLLKITTTSGSFTKFDPAERLRPFIDLTRVDDDFAGKKGFALKKEMAIEIIAMGEYISKDRIFVDYGYIINAETREKVWEMDKWNTSWAGGGRKNRAFQGEVTLPAGNYLAVYRSDDSHSFGDWNVPPPHDPLHYGLAIYPASAADEKMMVIYEDTYREPIILSLTEVGDDEFIQKGFTLDKSAEIKIVALGEYGWSDDFVDYGWIEDVATGEVVWKMTDDNTEHAGGARKNRIFEGVVTLPAGNYMVYFVSDDSHSYGSWNDTPPFEKEMWGITLFGVGKDFKSGSISLFDDAPESGNLLARVTGVGDAENVCREFDLKKPGKVHIFALGEGTDGDMYDYGWIEDSRSGDIVWEMTYRMTTHAGGADKNRQVTTDVYLDAGRYRACYTTDDSHSFPDFNASRPWHPQKWGITVTMNQ